MHTDIHQLFVLIQIPPTVDKYYDNHNMFQNVYNIICSVQNSNRPLPSNSDGPFYSFGGVYSRKLSCACRTVYWYQQHYD